MSVELYHFWSVPESQRPRLALAAKGLAFADRPLDFDDDATFFDLGLARHVPILRSDEGALWTDSVAILEAIDQLAPTGPALIDGILPASAWADLLAWRRGCDAILQRLYAPVRIAYQDIGSDATRQAAFRHELQERFGMGLEALANDRYDGYQQLDRLSDLRGLGRYLARHGFYQGAFSVADCLLAADLAPLRLLDGISIPMDIRYYLRRVEGACGLSLDEGLTHAL